MINANALKADPPQRDPSIGYCLHCERRLTRCGVPFSGAFLCRACGAVNIYEESQQPMRLAPVNR